MAQVDRINGLVGDLGVKAPVRVATTANITLSGLQTVDGVVLAAGDRVLVKDQTAGSENGIYAASATTWLREPDWDGSRDVVTGTAVKVNEGTQASIWSVPTTGDITVGTTSVAFDPFFPPSLDASVISNTPSGNIAATTVQAAIDELEAEKAADSAVVKLTGDQSISGVKTFTSPVGVAAAVASGDAVQLNAVSLMPTVASATSPDIFGAVGATINYTGSVTAASFAACAASQVGMVKRIICAGSPTFTASANLKIDGKTSGDHTYPANAILEVVAISTSSFLVTTIFASGSITVSAVGSITAGAAGGTVVQKGLYTRIADTVFYQIEASWTTHSGTGNVFINLSGLPTPISGYNPPATIIADGLTLTAGCYLAGASIIPSPLRVTPIQYPTGGGVASYVPIDTNVTSISISGQYKV